MTRTLSNRRDSAMTVERHPTAVSAALQLWMPKMKFTFALRLSDRDSSGKSMS